MTNNFWKIIELQLDDIFNVHAYYIGDNLCLRYRNTKTIMLNLDGTGLVVNKFMDDHKFNGKVYQPEHIHKKLKEVFVVTKRRGITPKGFRKEELI